MPTHPTQRPSLPSPPGTRMGGCWPASTGPCCPEGMMRKIWRPCLVSAALPDRSKSRSTRLAGLVRFFAPTVRSRSSGSLLLASGWHWMLPCSESSLGSHASIVWVSRIHHGAIKGRFTRYGRKRSPSRCQPPVASKKYRIRDCCAVGDTMPMAAQEPRRRHDLASSEDDN